MARVLILFAHPALEKSRVHRRLVAQLPDLKALTFHDLYEAYPNFDIDVEREQQLLAANDVIVLQHPFFWYSTPALLKQWEDLVLEHGWAYGSRGTALRGKRMLNLITTGGQASAYQADGMAGFTVRQLLVPIERSALLCGIEYVPPYLIQGTHLMTPADIEAAALRYRRTLELLCEDQAPLASAGSCSSLNEVLDPLLDRDLSMKGKSGGVP